MVYKEQEVLRQGNCGCCLGLEFGQLCGFGSSPCSLCQLCPVQRVCWGIFFISWDMRGLFFLIQFLPFFWVAVCPVWVSGRISKVSLSSSAGKVLSFLYLLYKGYRQPGEYYSQQPAVDSCQKADALLPSSIWNKGYRLHAARPFWKAVQRIFIFSIAACWRKKMNAVWRNPRPSLFRSCLLLFALTGPFWW